MSNLSPYPHRLNSYGTKCDENCEACYWVRLRSAVNVVSAASVAPVNSVAREVAELERMYTLPSWEDRPSQKGQAIIEYLFIMFVVALGVIAGVQGLARVINEAFIHIGAMLSQYLP